MCSFTLLLALACTVACASAGSIQLAYQKINGFTVKYVTVNLNDPEVVVTTAVAQGFPTQLEDWHSLLTRLHPDVAINGSYFCPHSHQPVGDIAVNGNLVYAGVVGTALCLTPDNRVTLRPGPQQMKPNWAGLRTVLCAGPRLLTQGEVTVEARAEGFRDPRVLGSAPRSAVAWRADGVLIFLTIRENISLSNLAYICQHLGAAEAMALDGGSSSGLYVNGRTITRPARPLSNLLVVYTSHQRYQQYADQVASATLPRLARLLPTGAPDTPVALADATAPSSPARPPAHIVCITHPDSTHRVHGTVPITIDVQDGHNVRWITLRINGVMRAISNEWPLEYTWNSMKEPDGAHTIEVIAWSDNHTFVARDSREVQVDNSKEIARQ